MPNYHPCLEPGCPRCGAAAPNMAPEYGDLRCVICGHVVYGEWPTLDTQEQGPGGPMRLPRGPCSWCGKPVPRPERTFCGDECFRASKRPGERGSVVTLPQPAAPW